jgi:casein kinase 1, epsilon
MAKMHDSDGFPQIKEQQGQDYLIMTLLGSSLSEVMQNHQIGIIDMKRIAYQCLLRLKELHERGFVHRDVKPDNILLGNMNNPHKVYIVDFGLSSSFKKIATIARKCYQGEIGTIKFCPIASHKGQEQFPKDDL